MKKPLALLALLFAAACTLTACSHSPSPAATAELPAAPSELEYEGNNTGSDPFNCKLEITIKTDLNKNSDSGADNEPMPLPLIPGARIRFHRGPSGKYSVEYVHTPYGVEKDESLDYSLEINPDNTYSMTVISDGIQSDHSGHWYMRRGNITFYYDEQIDPTAHNYYVSDSLFGEMMAGGKIMIYDNCRTIVLSKTYEVEPQSDRPYSEQH